MKRISLVVSILLAAVTIAACAQVQPKLTEQSVVYRDAPVYLSNLGVYIRPKAGVTQPIAALMFPFRISQHTEDPILLGREFAKIVWQNWTSSEVMPTLAFDQQLYYRNARLACAEARRRGADLAIIGEVPYFLVGGSATTNSITIKIMILNARTEQTVVSLEQSGRMEQSLKEDYVYFTYKTRMPESPLFEIINTIADQMAFPVKNWAGGLRYADKLNFATSKREIVSKLATPKPEAKAEPAPPRPAAAPATTQAPPPVKSTPSIQDLKDAGTATPSVNLSVAYDFDSDKIKPESNPILDELAEALKSPELKDRSISVNGHTDSAGDANYNLDLSSRRARSVKNYLVEKHGINPDRIETRGLGESQPLVPNTSPANRQINRRVEVQLK